jgi:hypothetical protein
MKIMSYAFWRVSLSIKLQPEQIMTGKKGWPDDCTFFFGRNFSGCNLNPLKNIAGQTTVGFFSGRNVPAKSEPRPSARRLNLLFFLS